MLSYKRDPCTIYKWTVEVYVNRVFFTGIVGSLVGCYDFRDCSTVDVSNIESLPLLLSQTGLYSDITTDTLSDSVVEFEPQYPLWTDGAKKRRWILLPEGGQVSTEDDEAWSYPIGTKFFKEFTRDGVRVETRLNMQTDQGWVAATYLWTQEGGEAERIQDALENASGTEHDIPSSAECYACHGGRENFALGFSAVQLEEEIKMRLYDMGLFSDVSTAQVLLEDNIKQGLGVLHANCSHCHNPTRNENPQATDCYNPGRQRDFDLTLPADIRSISDIPVLQTARRELLRRGILERMSQRNTSGRNTSMPPLGTEIVDEDGVEAVERLIEELMAEGY